MIMITVKICGWEQKICKTCGFLGVTGICPDVCSDMVLPVRNLRKLILFVFVGAIIIFLVSNYLKTRGIPKMQSPITTYGMAHQYTELQLKLKGHKSSISIADQNPLGQHYQFVNSMKSTTLSLVPTSKNSGRELENYESANQRNYKSIAVLGQLPNDVGMAPFENCQMKDCVLFEVQDFQNRRHINATVVIFDATNLQHAKELVRPWNQIWILNLMESPLNTPNLTELGNLINWTATYRTDSTIYAPYNEYKMYQEKDKQWHSWNHYEKLSETKIKSVAWFVTNCGSKSGRLKYVMELQKYIDVDIYGLCGTLKCGRENDRLCLENLRRDYKFYLSFENSNCKDYITEKFWKALQ